MAGTDLINRQDAIDAVCIRGTKEERKGHLSMSMVTVKQWAVDILEGLPSAERKGHWIDTDKFGEWWQKIYRCSECGEQVRRKSNYCLECGARMEWEGEEE